MSDPNVDGVDVHESGTNLTYDESGSTLIQPEKQISLDIGQQSNYTVLPALREDVYTISAVGDINGMLAEFPVPHTWQPADASGSPNVEYQVDMWLDASDTGDLRATSNDAEATSLQIRNRLFNHFQSSFRDSVNSFSSCFVNHIKDTDEPHGEMYFDPGYLEDCESGVHDLSGVMTTYDGSGMISTTRLFNEYLSDDGTIEGKHVSQFEDGANIDNSGANGTLYGQLQEALISWFESANYKDASSAALSPMVDPREHDILRSWMTRSSIDNRHLAKMSKDAIYRLLAKRDSLNPDQLDLSGQNTLMYCCFDAEQVKQIYSTIEFTGRVRSMTSQSAGFTTDVGGTAIPADGVINDSSGQPVSVVNDAGGTIHAPRHCVALRHGEGFAIVVPAKTRLRSGTTSEANLVVRVFQDHATAVSDSAEDA
jgi:hypothetical protein